jgi:hypothetical protein
MVLSVGQKPCGKLYDKARRTGGVHIWCNRSNRSHND